MPSTGANPPIDVAVGILTDQDRVFITRRSSGSHQGGKWEFPGGKIAPGENPLSALKRELWEELGIRVQNAAPFLQIRHVYPDREVFLDVWHVTGYQGTPYGNEGQEARWISCADLTSLEFPQADEPILRRLWMPALYLISDSRRFGSEEFLTPLERALAAGARLIQLREPHLPAEEYQAYAKRLAGLCHRYGAKLLLNSDPAWVPACDADGVHLNSRRLMEHQKRPLGNEYWVGASCHNAEELSRAVRIGADFAVLSPVAPTTSHPGATILGWESFSRLCAGTSLPVYALGGMRIQDQERAHRAGARGMAMVSEVWESDSIEETVAALAAL
ncbi:MAG: Nudix family hydrolase [Sulfuricaulis sp.]